MGLANFDYSDPLRGFWFDYCRVAHAQPKGFPRRFSILDTGVDRELAV